MRSLVWVVVLSLAPLAVIAGQAPPPLEPGQRVRVTVPNREVHQQQMTFLLVTPDRLVLSSASYALEEVTQLDVYLGRTSKAGTGALIGMLVGTGVGLAWSAGWIANDCVLGGGSGCEGGHFGLMALGTAGVALGGAVVGALLGAATVSHHWEEVPLDDLRMSTVSQRVGVRVGVRLEF